MAKKEEWFGTWFNSPYYHVLYKNRDFSEAESFLTKLVEELKPSEDATLLDLACGKGRHSIFLNKLGYKVKGVDLSNESIEHASKYTNKELSFSVHDMRVSLGETYDYVLNLFTSFGYFETEEENQSAINTMAGALNEGGILVVDFMNAKKVISNLVKSEQKEQGGLNFNLTREVVNGHIYKHISFQDNGQQHNYTEKVQALFEDDFIKYFNIAGLKLIKCFGNYELESFDEKKSDRLILIATK